MQEKPPVGVTLREVVGERIMLTRRRCKMTQPELAHQTGMGIATISRIEKGHQSMTIDKLVALAQVLGMSTDYLLGLTDTPERAGKTDNDAEREPATPGTALETPAA